MPTPDTLSAGSRAAADVAALLRARNPLIWITTREEARAERLLVEAAQTAQYEPRFWDCATGITDYTGRAQEAGERAKDPAQVLDIIRDSTKRQVWILRDLPAWLRDPSVNRSLRSLARSLTLAPRDEARAVIVLTPSSEIPPELAGHAIAIDFPLPDRSEIAALLDAAIAALPDDIRAAAAPNGTRDQAIDAAVGLTAEEAQACYAKSLVSTRRIDPATVASEKKRVIAREKVLEWFDPLAGGLDSVGGLDNLKTWLTARRAAFGPKARAYGLPAPRGALLVGVPGCGKSLTAKAIARQETALERLNKALGNNEASVVIGASGSLAFKGWNEREGLSDLCAYRKLAASNSPALRRAIMRAEALAGRKLDPRAIAAGQHSHDQGATWSAH